MPPKKHVPSERTALMINVIRACWAFMSIVGCGPIGVPPEDVPYTPALSTEGADTGQSTPSVAKAAANNVVATNGNPNSSSESPADSSAMQMRAATATTPSGSFPIGTYTTGIATNPAFGAEPTIYYPQNDNTALGLIALVPGYQEGKNAIDWWGPELASYGFAVIVVDAKAQDNPPSLRANALMAALDALAAEHTRKGSPLQGKLAVHKRAVMGHSMGGGGALIAAQAHSDLKAAIPFTPFSQVPHTFEYIHVPTLIIAGRGDTVADENIHAHAFYASIPDATPKIYMELPNGKHDCATNGNHNMALNIRYVMAFLKLYMDGDESARSILYGDEHKADVERGAFSRFESNGAAH